MIDKLPLPTEEQEQRAVISWAERLQVFRPDCHMLKWLFHIPNSGAGPLRGMAGRMKAMGAKRGVPDLFLAYPTVLYCGLFLEMKRRGNGKPSPEQWAWIADLKANGYMAEIAHGALDAERKILRYLFNLDIPRPDCFNSW